MLRNMTATHYLIVLIGVGLIALGGWQYYLNIQPSEYDELAQCIAESGATFYGAFWCPHCSAQKEMFGSAAELLPYVECSEADRQTQTAVCAEAGITGYPTWELNDGTRLSGAQTMARLAEATNCQLPEYVTNI